MIRILNLYAGIGGNRKLWSGDIEVTAIEWDEKIAAIYKDFFPNDIVIVADAHEYLLEHYSEFDFIWASPPCPSHGKIRRSNPKQNKPIYPDMKLYQEIILLKHTFKGLWCVENTFSYYDPLIKPFILGNHFYWCNFTVPYHPSKSREHDSSIDVLEKRKGFSLKGYKGVDKRLLLRNCVEPEEGLFLFNCAYKDKQTSLLDDPHTP